MTNSSRVELKGTKLKILRFIEEYFKLNGESPTIREIQHGIDVKSTSTVSLAVKHLIQCRYLTEIIYKSPRKILPTSMLSESSFCPYCGSKQVIRMCEHLECLQCANIYSIIDLVEHV